VVYVRSFLKSMLPTLRPGYVMAPELCGALRAAKYIMDWYTLRATLARFIDDGHSPGTSARCGRLGATP
jgi:DNA-binding transcriptional MocR family regulator